MLEKSDGTLKPLFRVGLNGSQLKNDGGVLTVRDASDGANDVLRAADSVGLDDLATRRQLLAETVIPQFVTAGWADADQPTLVAALAAITDATQAKPYVIQLPPGELTEQNPIIHKPYVTVLGFGFTATTIKPANQNAHLFIGAAGGRLRNVALQGPTGVGYACVYYAEESYVPMFVEDTVLRGGYYGLWADAPTSRNTLHAIRVGNEYSGVGIDNFMRCTRFGNVSAINCHHMSGPSPGAANVAYYCAGSDAEMYLDLCTAKDCATGLKMEDGCFVRMNACNFTKGTLAIHITNTGAGTTLQGRGVDIRQGRFTTDVLVELATAVGFIIGHADQAKVSTAVAPGFYLQYMDFTTAGGMVVEGEVWGGSDVDKSVPLVSHAKDTGSTGWVSGGEVTRAGGLNVAVALGEAYFRDTDSITPKAWVVVPTLLLTANSISWIGVNALGVVNASTTHPSHDANSVLAIAYTNATTVVALVTHKHKLSQLVGDRASYLEKVVGPVGVDGITASKAAATSVQVNVVAGEYYSSEYNLLTSALTPATFTAWYSDGSGGWTHVTGQTDIDPEQYDGGGGALLPTPAGEWVKPVMYVMSSEDGTEAHVVYPTETFVSQLDAENGGIPAAPFILRRYALRVASFVAQEGLGTPDIASVQDLRPFIGQNTPVVGSGAVTDHNLLTNRPSATAHTQYYRHSGLDALTGHMNVAGFNIVSPGTVDGRDVDADGTAQDSHISNVANPHAVTKAQVGLQSVLDDAMSAATYDPTAVGGDAFARANHTGTQTAATISDFDTEVSNNTDVDANTTARHGHTNKAQIDLVTDGDHDVIVSGNPHAVTKAEVGLGNVTNDAQLKRAAGDIGTFGLKAVLDTADVFLIEDSAAGGAKKRVEVSNIPTAFYGTRIDSTSLTSASGQPFVESKNLTYETVAMLLWPGTTQIGQALQAIWAMLNLAGGSSMDVRVYDITNNAVIAEVIGFTIAAWTVVTLGALTNVTALPAIWEVQLRGVGGGRKAQSAGLSYIY